MTLSPGAIAGIVIVCFIALCVVAYGIYYVIKKRREDAEYFDRCAKLFKKYGNRKPEVVAKFPYAEATFVRAPVPGQQFTSRELGRVQEFIDPLRAPMAGDTERTPMASMQTPIDPAAIDPRLYSSIYSQESIQMTPSSTKSPQVYFSIEYDSTFNILKVYIDQARFLKPQHNSNVCNPYCTVALLPERKERQSQIQRRTTDPIFQEHFSFDVPKHQLKDKTVLVKFFDYDQYSRDECFGIVTQKLDEINVERKVDLWKKISFQKGLVEEARERAGDILLRLGYLPSAEKLTVVLLKARSLKEVGPEGDKKPPDPYIRVAVLHDGNLLRKKKTSTKRKTCNPTYNQAINFAVPLDVLPQVELQFHVVHETGVKINRKEVIGALEIGPHSTGDEFEHWRDLMSNKPQARWHRLTVSPDQDTTSARSILSSTSSITEATVYTGV
ncbi:synaptotagmin-5-like [Clavelina lepadiformis]|uniref:synaptotagmin-5-like n=1 Tax=Clavelina lepadiformis TaxID=159417 RepID=UPI0040436292